ncbi:MAG TPA: hypothetical protein VK625_17260 [Flavitalea sp.]|nr:hypothetical protein [Flavitalea sp.]
MNETKEKNKRLSTQQSLNGKPKIIAQVFNSGFDDSHDTYNAISAASDGRIYYVLSSDKIDIPGRVYSFDPKETKIDFLGDLNEICDEDPAKTIVQGKSHVRFYEKDNKLYFSTHIGYYELIDGMDRLPQSKSGSYELYPGGHFIEYDLKTQKFKSLGKIPGGEGAVSMTMDTKRGNIFAISWSTGNLIHFNITTNLLKNLGPVSEKGEAGKPGEDFRSLCRSLFIHPATGNCYFSVAEGDIHFYDLKLGGIRSLDTMNLRLDYFGNYDHTQPGSMGYNWRKIFWHDSQDVAYGVHGNSGYLFMFDPLGQDIEIVDRITSEPSKKCGMFDQFSYGYLGFILGPDKETIYYLTGGPVFENGKRLAGEKEIAKGAAKGVENLHLVTYNIPEKIYKDHGPIFYENGERPLYVNSIAIGDDGNIYTLARVKRNGKTITDLIRFKNPLHKR